MTFTISDIEPDLNRIADSLAIQWPGIDSDDIRQEMVAKVLEDMASLNRHKDGEKIAIGLAKKRGIQYCSTERQYWQNQTAEWIYTPREVRALLAEFFLADAWEDAPKRPENGQTITGDGISVALMDIRSAYHAISEGDQATILTAFRAGEKPADDAERKRRNRAVDRVTAYLNRRMSARESDREFRDGPGSRAVTSNATARYATGSNY